MRKSQYMEAPVQLLGLRLTALPKFRQRPPALFLNVSALAIGLSLVYPKAASAQTMTFEGLQNNELVNNFYNGGTGSLGSKGTLNLGVQWTSALAGFAPNGTFSNVANEPSPPTVMGFISGPAPVMNVAAGFSTGFSFYYSAANTPGLITVWSGLNGTGSVLATLNLPVNGSNPNFAQSYSNWTPIGVSFNGTADSVTFGGTANFIVFDDVTINSIIPNQSNPTQTINTTQPYFLASTLGSTLSPAFQGGVLRLDQSGGAYSQNFTLDGSATNTFDQFGNTSTISGVISNAVAGTPGQIIFANSGTGGSVTLTGANTYSGTTTINSGATLVIGSGGSITNQSSITNSGTFVVNQGAKVTVAAITNKLTGVLSNFGTITDALNNSGQVFNIGTFNSDVNNLATGTINNSGTWNGSLLSNTGSVINTGAWNAVNFANNTGGTVTTTGSLISTASITNAGTFSAQGILTAPTFTNSGNFNVTGALSGTIGTLTNSGTVSLANGTTTNTLAANNFVSQNGTLVVNANFAANATGQRASLLNVGTLSGNTNVVVGAGTTPGLIATPIPIINAGTVAAGTSVTAAVLNAPNSNIINYSVIQAGTQYDLISTVNTGHVASPPTGIDAILTALNTGFFQNASAFISEPPNPTPNQVNGGPWIRFSGGQNDVSSTTSATNPTGVSTAQTKVRTSFNGFQTGIDLGVANIQNTGWNTHVGVTAGQVLLSTDNIAGSSATSQNTIPFLGVYFALTGHGFFADGMIREDFYNVGITDQQASLNNSTITGKALSVNWSAGYKFDITPQFFIEPSAALMYSQLHMEALRLPLDTSNQTYGTLAFNPFNSLLGRFGVRLGTTYVAEQYGLALQPFVTGSVWHEFDSATTSTFQANGVNVPLSVTRIGTFGQLGVGVSGQILQTGLVGFVRGDYRFGQNINGYNVVGGLRYEF